MNVYASEEEETSNKMLGTSLIHYILIINLKTTKPIDKFSFI